MGWSKGVGAGEAGVGQLPSRAAPAPLIWVDACPWALPRSPPAVSEGHGPVLKHGPRSAACMQGERILIPMYRNETNLRG